MGSIESIIAELKSLPRAQLERAARYIHQLREEGHAGRVSAFRSTSGTLTSEEADEWLKAIDDCERVDESTW
jgi:hypothetical protein